MLQRDSLELGKTRAMLVVCVCSILLCACLIIDGEVCIVLQQLIQITEKTTILIAVEGR